LSIATGISSIENKPSSEITSYPNPMVDNMTFEIFPPVTEYAVISDKYLSYQVLKKDSIYLLRKPACTLRSKLPTCET